MARNSGSTSGAGKDNTPDPGANIDQQVQDSHEARTQLVDDSGLESTAVVDARLDNRAGADRPARVDFPAVPQQVDGPDVAHQAEFTRRFLSQQKSANPEGLLGMSSPGPHGLSDAKERQGHDRAAESGGKPAKNGEEGSPIVGKPEARGSQRR
jgi:hypothetical protein